LSAQIGDHRQGLLVHGTAQSRLNTRLDVGRATY
jgi:hypothetical protein